MTQSIEVDVDQLSGDEPWGADNPADIDDGLAAINRLIDACERVDGIDQHAAPDLGIAKDEIVRLREFMRLHGEIYPHLEDQQPYIPVYVLCDNSEVQYVQAVLSDYGAAVNWLDADRDNRSLLFFALNKMAGEYVTNEEPAK